MNDEQRRLAERRGAVLSAEAERRGTLADRTIWRGLVGEWVYLEVGPNYHLVGVLVHVYLDELGRGIGVLDKVRVKQDERDGQPTGWLTSPGSDMRVPSTEVSICQPACQRWPDWSPDL